MAVFGTLSYVKIRTTINSDVWSGVNSIEVRSFSIVGFMRPYWPIFKYPIGLLRSVLFNLTTTRFSDSKERYWI